MLYIYIEEDDKSLPSDYMSRVSDCFDGIYLPEWFSDPFVREMIEIIDNSVVEQNNTTDSINIFNSVLGNIPPQNLSTGVKALILLYKTDLKIDGDRLGDNCIPLLLRIADKKDITISLGHFPAFPDKFDAIIVNNGVKIHSDMEFFHWRINLV